MSEACINGIPNCPHEATHYHRRHDGETWGVVCMGDEVTAAFDSLRAALAAAERRAEEAEARLYELEQQRSGFDCRFAGPYAEMSGRHCPADRPCARCEADRIERERDEARRDHESACLLVAKMHHAATGGTDGPRIGVVEDVAALREERDRLRDALKSEQAWAKEYHDEWQSARKLLMTTERERDDAVSRLTAERAIVASLCTHAGQLEAERDRLRERLDAETDPNAPQRREPRNT